ncbi:MAG: peptidyl-alpha-hydroxyglycine alpha-amidating lyase family protein [Pirellulaceae bacterium]
MSRSALLSMLLACSSFIPLVGAEEIYDLRPAAGFLQLPPGLELGACAAVAVGGKGEIYLFHRGERPILCFDGQGEFLRGWGDDVIDTAHGLRLDGEGNLWATDMAQHRVFKFDPQGKLLLSLGTGRPGDGPDQFNKPTDIAFGARGAVFISDGYGNSRVMKFTPGGRLIKSWGVRGKGKGEFHLPHSIVVDRQGRLLVGDRENDRIQVFDQEGALLDVWNGFAPYGLALDAEGNVFVADGRANQVLRLDASGKVVRRWGEKGSGLGQFLMPHMLCFDRQGDLLVAEVGGKRLQKLKRVQ